MIANDLKKNSRKKTKYRERRKKFNEIHGLRVRERTCFNCPDTEDKKVDIFLPSYHKILKWYSALENVKATIWSTCTFSTCFVLFLLFLLLTHSNDMKTINSYCIRKSVVFIHHVVALSLSLYMGWYTNAVRWVWI